MKLILIVFLLIASKSTFSQDTAKMIVWAPFRLQWNMFKEDNSYFKYGKFSSKLHYEFTIMFNSIDSEHTVIPIYVAAYILPESCWVSRYAVGNEDVLRHEQLHFDIVELYARKLRKGLLEKQWALKSYRRKILSLRENLYTDLKQTQDFYDFDTEHGTNLKRQVWWQTSIYLQLKALEVYDKCTVLVKVP